MVSSLSSLSTIPDYSSLTTPSSTTSVAQTSDESLIESAVDLSANAGVIATLGIPSVDLQTYDASGLLNSFVQAGSVPADAIQVPSEGADTQDVGQELLDQEVLSTLSADPALSGVYTSAGTVQGLSSDTTANWASALQANPSLAATVAADTFSQGVVGTLLGVA
jgi:hypothetical protein